MTLTKFNTVLGNLVFNNFLSNTTFEIYPFFKSNLLYEHYQNLDHDHKLQNIYKIDTFTV